MGGVENRGRRPRFSTPPNGTWRVLMHWKIMFDRYYCIKTENICYFSRYFLHFFVSPFHRCRANAISTDYARSGTGQYTSRDGSNSVAPVPAYWKLRSRALTARELPVNARLLITCDYAFYAIMYSQIWIFASANVLSHDFWRFG